MLHFLHLFPVTITQKLLKSRSRFDRVTCAVKIGLNCYVFMHNRVQCNRTSASAIFIRSPVLEWMYWSRQSARFPVNVLWLWCTDLSITSYPGWRRHGAIKTVHLCFHGNGPKLRQVSCTQCFGQPFLIVPADNTPRIDRANSYVYNSKRNGTDSPTSASSANVDCAGWSVSAHREVPLIAAVAAAASSIFSSAVFQDERFHFRLLPDCFPHHFRVLPWSTPISVWRSRARLCAAGDTLVRPRRRWMLDDIDKSPN